MTNNELIEELYHKAHAKGFLYELHDKVKELKQNYVIDGNTKMLGHG